MSDQERRDRFMQRLKADPSTQAAAAMLEPSLVLFNAKTFVQLVDLIVDHWMATAPIAMESET